MTLDIFFERYLLTLHAIVVAFGLIVYVGVARALPQRRDPSAAIASTGVAIRSTDAAESSLVPSSSPPRISIRANAVISAPVEARQPSAVPVSSQVPGSSGALSNHTRSSRAG